MPGVATPTLSPGDIATINGRYPAMKLPASLLRVVPCLEPCGMTRTNDTGDVDTMS